MTLTSISRSEVACAEHLNTIKSTEQQKNTQQFNIVMIRVPAANHHCHQMRQKTKISSSFLLEFGKFPGDNKSATVKKKLNMRYNLSAE